MKYILSLAATITLLIFFQPYIEEPKLQNLVITTRFSLVDSKRDDSLLGIKKKKHSLKTYLKI